jgi:hypothetical protein
MHYLSPVTLLGTVVVTHTLIPIEENPFPEKLALAQDILSKTKFLDR